MKTGKVQCALTIAGSDSSGGAGIEADIKTFAALGVYGTCAITAITAQNTRGVYEILPIPPKKVKQQIDTILQDIPIETAKTGMLYTRETIEIVAEAIYKHKLRVVVDPVFRAGTGNLLIREKDKEALIEKILPKAFIATPNLHEAEEIAKTKISNINDMKNAAEKIAKLGAKAVVIKGGHMKEQDITDLLYYNEKFETFTRSRIKVETHGAGCVFSATITAYLALNHDVRDAVAGAEHFIQDAITFSAKIGKGRIPLNPMAQLTNEAEKHKVIENVSTAAKMIEKRPELLPHIAEVGTQIAMALPNASTKMHIAAIEGRIVKFGNQAKAVGCAGFGVSSHLARIILTVMRYDNTKRAALNLHCDENLVKAFKKLGLVVSYFDRKLEPPEVKTAEGETLSWGVTEAIKKAGKVPDVVYDLGEVGKEPMIRVLGSSATDVVKKTLTAVIRKSK